MSFTSFSNFNKIFSRVKHRNIILYGLNNVSVSIIKNNRNFKILGIDYKEKKKIKDIKKTEIEKNLHLKPIVIITTKSESAKIIYIELSSKFKKKVEIFFLDGSKELAKINHNNLNYNQINLKFRPPTFGLNFLENKNIKDKNLMLLSGFEKFDKFFVRIDILERLFIKLYNFQSQDKEIKLIPEMLNLLGCSKDNFINLIKLMNYKSFEKENDTYIKYIPRKMKKFKKFKDIRNDNPFEVLNKISFK